MYQFLIKAMIISTILILMSSLIILLRRHYFNQNNINTPRESLGKENDNLKNLEQVIKDAYINNLMKETMWQLGSLIYCQEHNYVEKYPKNAEIYSIIGSIIRIYANKATNQYDFLMPVCNIIEKDPDRFHQNQKEILERIKYFRIPNLIDLVSEMQGKVNDDCFLECVEIIKDKL